MSEGISVLKRENLNKAAQALKDLDVSPLDLFTMAYLLNLEAETSKFRGIDIDVHYGLREEIVKSLKRKAELESSEGQSFYKELIAKMHL